MKKKQWFVLAWSCMLIGMMFIGIDMMNNHCLDAKLNMMVFEPADLSDVWCVVNAEIYEPFVYLSYALWIVFIICGWIEKGSEK